MHRRRRLHRPVGGAARLGRGPVARRGRCWRPRRSAPAPAGATAASSTRRSPTGWPTAWRASPTRWTSLERLGRENFAGLRADLERSASTAHFERPGELDGGAGAPRAGLADGGAAAARASATRSSCSTAPAMRAQVASPTYLRRALGPHGRGAARPRRGWPRGCATRCAGAGVRVHEHTRGAALQTRGAGVDVDHARAAASARAGCCWPPAPIPRCCARCARYVAPVYDYVLVTEPLSARAARAIGWARRPGHRRRRQPVPLLPPDRRRPASCSAATTPSTASAGRSARAGTSTTPTFARLSQHFFAHVPAARGRALHATLGRRDRHVLRFSRLLRHRARRAASPTRSATPGWASPPRASAPASRSTCSTAADTEATRLRYVRSPAGARSRPSRCARAVIQLTRNRLAAADRREGRRGLWLRTLDRLGLGFDS